MSKDFANLFQQELDRLQYLLEEFAKKHPEMGPMISGKGADPSIERLKQSVAFQITRLRLKLDDDLPEITQGILGRISNYLRPVPAVSTVAFTPDQSITASALIPKGTPLKSKPVEDAVCRFATCYDVEIHPLILIDACFEQDAGQFPHISLTLELTGMGLNDWDVEKLRFFIAGEYAEAADLYYLLMRRLKQIVIRPLDGGSPCIRPGSDLRDAGFLDESALMPYSADESPAVRILQEYFISRDKFLYVDLHGWEQWRNRGGGSRFEICLEFDSLPVKKPRVTKDTIVLYSTPVINIYETTSKAIAIDPHKQWNLLRPDQYSDAHEQVFSVESVTGLTKGMDEIITCPPLGEFARDSEPAVYNLSYRTSPLGGDPDVFISVDSPAVQGGADRQLTITAVLKCTNGRLPEALGVGDISEYDIETPQFATFTNIKPVTAGFYPAMGKNSLWHALSFHQFNRHLLKDRRLCRVLEVYAHLHRRDYPAVIADRRRIAGIQSFGGKRALSLFQGNAMRGSEVEMRILQDHFPSLGDLYLFGCVMDHFLGAFVTENSFTQLVMKEEKTGQIYEWPARIGYRRTF